MDVTRAGPEKVDMMDEGTGVRTRKWGGVVSLLPGLAVNGTER